MQSKTISFLALSLAFAIGSCPLHAEELSKSGKPLTAQQARMKACNADAKTQALKGDERKAFMSTCLKGAHAPVATPETPAASASAPATAPATETVAKVDTPRQAQRKACGAEAKSQSLKGDDRKEFVKECMKRPAANGAT